MEARRCARLGIVASLLGTCLLYFLFLPQNIDGNAITYQRNKFLSNLEHIGNSLSSRIACITNACYSIPHETTQQFFEHVFQICLGPQFQTEKFSSNENTKQKINIVVVACGNRLEEALVNIKSSLLFGSNQIVYHIFAEDQLHEEFEAGISMWPRAARHHLQYHLYPITFPQDGNGPKWKSLFKPCASQRLFLPLILSDIESVIYVDTDILFISDVRDLWHKFTEFNSTQLASLCIEHEDKHIGWYNRFARHPYYGMTGLNSGVMLMNLTRMRKFKYKNDLMSVKMSWSDMLLPLYKKYKYNITWGDQDLLNIVFHYNPEMLHIFPCNWNYRPDHCMYGQMCKSAQKDGVRIVHGSRQVYHNEKEPAFKAVYNAIHSYGFQSDKMTYLFQVLQKNLDNSKDTYCGRASKCLLDGLRKATMADLEN